MSASRTFFAVIVAVSRSPIFLERRRPLWSMTSHQAPFLNRSFTPMSVDVMLQPPQEFRHDGVDAGYRRDAEPCHPRVVLRRPNEDLPAHAVVRQRRRWMRE